ncbi:Co/Zn/Cd efflux system membrane fusion protein [Klebsiella pneumoniae]|uniref:Co/Zn/Cd efflux system membrane fusion protein n=1 Tax=Klebsiella pneumoniae TaxID=573 RepID=A0A3S4H601_KLEPN|nr:Co/Zn/Cd efflux system membrane fusion protein [Klebsiella pneumoniae]
MWSSAFPEKSVHLPGYPQYRLPSVVRINTLPGREFTAEYKEHTGSSDNSTLTWQIVLTMPRPDDFPAVGGVSGTVTVNLGNLPASAGRKPSLCQRRRWFNPDNRPKNEPVVWVGERR